MEPSHTRRYRSNEVEVKAIEVLRRAYPEGVNIPVDIDWLAEQHEIVDSIIPAESLEQQFKVAAVLVSKPNGHADIFVDEETSTFQKGRANFSIAHELGHVVLHAGIYEGCYTIEESIELNKRIKNSYSRIEREANWFAEAILIPRRTIYTDTAKVYEGVIKRDSYDKGLVPGAVCRVLARRYNVTLQPMSIRLERLKLNERITEALEANLPYMDLYK